MTYAAREENVIANLRRIGALVFAEGLCARNGVKLSAVISRRRSRTLNRVRHELWRLVHDTFGFSFPETGSVFGVDHSTVVHAVVAAKRRAA